MMKKAVSFRPIVDIQQFITENICDIPDKPDIEAMQQNIRDYKRHEQMAQRQEEKLAALNQISRLHGEMKNAAERWKTESFLVHWARKAALQEQIDGRERERLDCAKERGEHRKRDRFAQRQGAGEGGTPPSGAWTRDYAQGSDTYQGARSGWATQKQSLLTEHEQAGRQEMERDALEIKREALRLTHLCETAACSGTPRR